MAKKTYPCIRVAHSTPDRDLELGTLVKKSAQNVIFVPHEGFEEYDYSIMTKMACEKVRKQKRAKAYWESVLGGYQAAFDVCAIGEEFKIKCELKDLENLVKRPIEEVAEEE